MEGVEMDTGKTENSRMEAFAIDNFSSLWTYLKFVDSPLTRPNDNGEKSKSDSTEEIHQIIHSRYLLFRGYLINQFEKNYHIYACDGVAIYHYLCKNINDLLPYSGMNIFDKMMMSSVIVGHIGELCHYRKHDIFKKVLPLCWAMYFEKEEKDKFLAAGGWEELKSYTEKYYSRILHPSDVFLIALHYKNDRITVQELFKNSEKMYSLKTVIDTFKQRLHGRNDKLACSKCLPLYDVLHVLSYESKDEIDSFKIVEGYYQIFLRMLPKKLIKEIYHDIVHQNLGDANIAQGELIALNNSPELNYKLKTAFTENFIQRLFAIDPSFQIIERCIFCGEVLLHHLVPFTQEEKLNCDTDRKSIIQRTVSDVESSATAETSQK